LGHYYAQSQTIYNAKRGVDTTLSVGLPSVNKWVWTIRLHNRGVGHNYSYQRESV